MQTFLQNLLVVLAERGWRLCHETRCAGPAGPRSSIEWLIESLTPPVGRRVRLYFRVSFFDDYYHEYDFEVLVRAAEWPGGASPEETLQRWEAGAERYRRLLRVLEWFRDPWAAELWDTTTDGDWLPPASWDPSPLRPAEHEDWERCRDPATMLLSLRGSTSDRKLLLLACAICRQLPLAMMHDRNRLAVETAERHAEGEFPRRDLKKACKPSDVRWLWNLPPFAAVEYSLRALGKESVPLAPAADLIRDIAGNPFRPTSIRRLWLKSNGAAVQQLAETIGKERTFDHLPVLADALEDAGCTEQAILEHCRGQQTHVPGCWVVDLLRGRK